MIKKVKVRFPEIGSWPVAWLASNLVWSITDESIPVHQYYMRDEGAKVVYISIQTRLGRLRLDSQRLRARLNRYTRHICHSIFIENVNVEKH